MSAQRARSAVAAGHRSIHPNLPGVPWWIAMLIAATATAVGFAFDAGSGAKQLTNIFSALYVAGCVAAVLAVRQSGVFTAVIQPPLVLFCAVPGAYWLFHGATFTGIKDLLINCGYPLIERFPLMLFTSAGVLLIGMIRWYVGMTTRLAATPTKADTATAAGPRGGVIAKLASIFRRSAEPDETGEAPAAAGSRRAPAAGQPAKTSKPAGGGPTKRPARSRQVRPPLDDTPEPKAQRSRRRRPTHARDLEAAAEPPRRPRPPRDPDLRAQPPREIRRDPHVRRGRPTTRSSRFDPDEPTEPYEAPPHRRPAQNMTNGTMATHHPISRVRYRGSARIDEPRGEPRPREPRKPNAESWEYDI